MKVGDSLRDSPEFYRVLKASDGSIQSLAMFVNEHKQPVVLVRQLCIPFLPPLSGGRKGILPFVSNAVPGHAC
jgi:hypothetical protein